jgi:hypothetical protein
MALCPSGTASSRSWQKSSNRTGVSMQQDCSPPSSPSSSSSSSQSTGGLYKPYAGEPLNQGQGLSSLGHSNHDPKFESGSQNSIIESRDGAVDYTWTVLVENVQVVRDGDDWECATCTLLNPLSALHCSVCSSEKSSQEKVIQLKASNADIFNKPNGKKKTAKQYYRGGQSMYGETVETATVAYGSKGAGSDKRQKSFAALCESSDEDEDGSDNSDNDDDDDMEGKKEVDTEGPAGDRMLENATSVQPEKAAVPANVYASQSESEAESMCKLKADYEASNDTVQSLEEQLAEAMRRISELESGGKGKASSEGEVMRPPSTSTSTVGSTTANGSGATRTSTFTVAAAGINPFTTTTASATASAVLPMVADVSWEWSCEQCTLLNPAHTSYCSMCDHPRPAGSVR